MRKDGEGGLLVLALNWVLGGRVRWGRIRDRGVGAAL